MLYIYSMRLHPNSKASTAHRYCGLRVHRYLVHLTASLWQKLAEGEPAFPYAVRIDTDRRSGRIFLTPDPNGLPIRGANRQVSIKLPMPEGRYLFVEKIGRQVVVAAEPQHATAPARAIASPWQRQRRLTPYLDRRGHVIREGDQVWCRLRAYGLPEQLLTVFFDEETEDFYLNATGARYDERGELQASFGFTAVGQENMTVVDAEYLAPFGGNTPS
ncbi:MAG: hypothetical protein M3O70_11670 [Actinomycetota bacterium]|nr:hypothetical protein [Actinomycetota bacterium]